MSIVIAWVVKRWYHEFPQFSKQGYCWCVLAASGWRCLIIHQWKVIVLHLITDSVYINTSRIVGLLTLWSWANTKDSIWILTRYVWRSKSTTCSSTWGWFGSVKIKLMDSLECYRGIQTYPTDMHYHHEQTGSLTNNGYPSGQVILMWGIPPTFQNGLTLLYEWQQLVIVWKSSKCQSMNPEPVCWQDC